LDILKNTTSIDLSYYPHNPEPNDKVEIFGYLISYRAPPVGGPISPNNFPLLAKPLSDANIIVLLVNATDMTIINSSTTKTNSFGTFNTSAILPQINLKGQASPYQPQLFIAALYDGNNVNFSGYTMKLVTFNPASFCKNGTLDTTFGYCRPTS